MFAEIAWKKKQKNARQEWEAANGESGGGGLMRTQTAPASVRLEQIRSAFSAVLA